MTKHILDHGGHARPPARSAHYLRIERGDHVPVARRADLVWMRRQPAPTGRTVSAFAAIERGRRV